MFIFVFTETTSVDRLQLISALRVYDSQFKINGAWCVLKDVQTFDDGIGNFNHKMSMSEGGPIEPYGGLDRALKPLFEASVIQHLIETDFGTPPIVNSIAKPARQITVLNSAKPCSGNFSDSKHDAVRIAEAYDDKLGWTWFHADLGLVFRSDKIIDLKCGACGTPLECPLRCSACLLVSYCSTGCQRAHWKGVHRTVCHINAAATVSQLCVRAAAGDASAQFNLGACFSNGIGVTKDCLEATRWLQLAANQGDVYAAIVLGSASNTLGLSDTSTGACRWFVHRGHNIVSYSGPVESPPVV